MKVGSLRHVGLTASRVYYVDASGDSGTIDITKGGGTNTIIIGNGASDPQNSNNAIIWGSSATISDLTGANDSIVIGTSASVSGFASSACIVIGLTANADSADAAIVIGAGSSGDADNAIAIGASSTASNTEAIAIGNSATASGLDSVAIGDTPTASGTDSIAIGNMAQAYAQSSIVIGATATDGNVGNVGCIVIGSGAQITGVTSLGSIAIGEGARCDSDEAIAIGQGALSQNADGIAIGDAARVSGNYGISIGNNSDATAQETICMGNGADATAGSAICIGTIADATAPQAIALGYAAQSTSNYTISIGGSSDATATEAIAIGRNAQATFQYGIAIGTGAEASGGEGNIAIGDDALANSPNADAIAIGTGSDAGGGSSTAIGNGADASATDSVAIGQGANSSGQDALALLSATASANDAIAIGNGTTVSGEVGGIAIGAGSSVIGAGIFGIAIGNGATITTDNVLAFGSTAGTAAYLITEVHYNDNTSEVVHKAPYQYEEMQEFQGGLRINYDTVTTGTTFTDDQTHIEATSAGITHYMWASPVTGDYINILNSAVGPITVSGNGENIDGSATVDVPAGTSITLAYNGTQWRDIGARPNTGSASGETAKGWIQFDGSGTPSIADSFNVTGITDNAAGDWTINWDTDFANANYCVVAQASKNSGDTQSTIGLYHTSPIAVGSARLLCVNATGTGFDAPFVCVVAYGDQ